jgi:pectate lyase
VKRVSYVTGIAALSLFFLTGVVLAADGFGTNTTGGEGGTTVTVGNAAHFKGLVETAEVPYVVQVSGTIDLGSVGGRVSIRSNKTIMGVDPNAVIIGQLGFKKGSSNVIIERLTITNPEDYGEGDGVSVKEDISNVFITKCTFYDCGDGCLDITRRSDHVTVSWCKFYFTGPNGDKSRVSLVGSGDSATDDLGKLHITFHHNWFDTGCWQRIPSVRFGRVHIYNNYYSCPGNLYGIRSRIQAECLIENNYFDSIHDPYYIYVHDPGEITGKIRALGNVRVNCTGRVDDGDDDVFVPPYSYTPDDALDVPTIVQLGAGVGGTDFFPHWVFGLYGDFDLNDRVDTGDLSQCADYWLLSGIADADYNDDGIVNGYEFALFAGNWLRTTADFKGQRVPADLPSSTGEMTDSLE